MTSTGAHVRPEARAGEDCAAPFRRFTQVIETGRRDMGPRQVCHRFRYRARDLLTRARKNKRDDAACRLPGPDDVIERQRVAIGGNGNGPSISRAST